MWPINHFWYVVIYAPPFIHVALRVLVAIVDVAFHMANAFFLLIVVVVMFFYFLFF